MKLLMTDRPVSAALPQDAAAVDLSALRIANCVGCFGCWTKTPGRCVIRDDAVRVYPLIARSEQVLLQVWQILILSLSQCRLTN